MNWCIKRYKMNEHNTCSFKNRYDQLHDFARDCWLHWKIYFDVTYLYALLFYHVLTLFCLFVPIMRTKNKWWIWIEKMFQRLFHLPCFLNHFSVPNYFVSTYIVIRWKLAYPSCKTDLSRLTYSIRFHEGFRDYYIMRHGGGKWWY